MMAECDSVTVALMWFSLTMYITLCGLNFYWCKLMVMGLLKFAFKKDNKKQEKQEKKEDDASKKDD